MDTQSLLTIAGGAVGIIVAASLAKAKLDLLEKESDHHREKIEKMEGLISGTSEKLAEKLDSRLLDIYELISNYQAKSVAHYEKFTSNYVSTDMCKEYRSTCRHSKGG